MNNFCHNDLVFSFSQIYQIIIIWNNQRNIFHHHSQNQAKEKRPFKTSLPLRQSNAHPSQQNAPVRLICARTGPILSQIYRPIKLMFKKSVQTPFKIKMQFNSIKLFARFVFLGWLFNFISNLLLFNQTDYVLLYTVFTHFVLPPLHSRHLSKQDCKNAGLNIVDLETNPDLQDAILSLHHCYMILFDKFLISKVVENNIGGRYMQNYNAK